jgi:hypothetical protein
MTDERRPIRQISGNLQEFRAAISELTDAVAGSARITAFPEVILYLYVNRIGPDTRLSECGPSHPGRKSLIPIND